MVSIVLIFGCTNDSTYDLTQTNDVFRGITYTNEEGDIISRPDSSDWNLFGGPSPYFASFETFPSYKTNKVHPMSPIGFHVGPAYGNPAQDSVIIPINVPVSYKYVIKLIDENFHIIKTFSGSGVNEIFWDLHDLYGNRVIDGIYRAAYQIEFENYNGLTYIHGHGDIWVK